MIIPGRETDRQGTARTTRRAFLDRARNGAAALAGAGWLASLPHGRAEKEVLPKHVTPETLRAVVKGLDYLAAQQTDDGSWITGGGQAYPVAMTGLAGTAFLAHGDSPTRGKYAKTVQGAVEFLVRCATPTGLITGPTQEVRISKAKVKEMRPGTVSVMPTGLDQQLTPQELADLLAFLKACR